MKVLENINLYVCEHCKKRYLKKHACEIHEILCYSNPENFRACSHCIHLEETTIDYEKDIIRCGENLGVIFDTETRKAKTFHCKKLDKLMYPFKAEKKGLIEMYPETFENQEQMPKTCDQFKHEWHLEFP